MANSEALTMWGEKEDVRFKMGFLRVVCVVQHVSFFSCFS